MISSNRKNSVFLRAKDPAMAQSWYNAIQAGAASLLPRVKEEMKSMQPGMEVKHLGWITEQVCEKTDLLYMVKIEKTSSSEFSAYEDSQSTSKCSEMFRPNKTKVQLP